MLRILLVNFTVLATAPQLDAATFIVDTSSDASLSACIEAAPANLLAARCDHVGQFDDCA